MGSRLSLRLPCLEPNAHPPFVVWGRGLAETRLSKTVGVDQQRHPFAVVPLFACVPSLAVAVCESSKDTTEGSHSEECERCFGSRTEVGSSRVVVELSKARV